MRAMTRTRRRLFPATGVLLLALVSCDAAPKRPAAVPTTSSPSPLPTATQAAPAVHPVSLQALMRRSFNGSGFAVGRVISRNEAYRRYFITYRSGRFRISGIMNVPAGNGPFPALILNHGYRDVDTYLNGQGFRREQDYLARRGYVIVHTDYRNHAQSDDDPRWELDLRLGYAEDAINAVLGLRAANLPYVDAEKIGMLGRSMGGSVTYNAVVALPNIVKAAVVYAPVSSDYVDNFNRWTSRRRPIARAVEAAYGSPSENPTFWRNVSAINFFDRVAVPMQIHHGTSDDTCPIAWTYRTVAALKAAGKSVSLEVYQGEEHEFAPQWLDSIRRARSFLDRYLKA